MPYYIIYYNDYIVLNTNSRMVLCQKCCEQLISQYYERTLRYAFEMKTMTREALDIN